MTNDLANAHRIVVKVGSSSLTTAAGGLDLERVEPLVSQLAKAHQAGRQLVLVSSGAIAAGLKPLGLQRRPKDLPSQQAAASVGQGLLLAHYTELFAQFGIRIGQVLLTAQDLNRRVSYSNALSTMSRLLRLGAIPIVNENDTVATNEIRFGDNDRLAALVAHLVRSDALVLLSDVDGLYTTRPDDPNSEFISEVTDLTKLEIDTSKPGAAGVGTGGMTAKLMSAEIATSAGIPVVLTRPENLSAVLAGEKIGSYFHPGAKRPARKLLWLAHGTDSCGKLFIDDGAKHALSGTGASLLAAGITKIEGDFNAGDPVDLIASDSQVMARGIVNYRAAELQMMLGRTTKDLVKEFGHGYEKVVVHRDELIILSNYQQQIRKLVETDQLG